MRRLINYVLVNRKKALSRTPQQKAGLDKKDRTTSMLLLNAYK
jgi:hypothetical protein